MVLNADVKQASTAIMTNNLSKLKELVTSGFPVNDLVFHENSNLLLLATEERKPKLVRYLLEIGADPNCKNDQFGDTPLHIACYEGDITIVELLLESADPDLENNAGVRPIIKAIESKSGLKLARMLEAAGASLKTQGKFGLLHAAARQADPKLIDFLISQGSDPNEFAGNSTPLMVAVRDYDTVRVYPSLRGFSSTPRPKIVKCLLDHGADPLAVYPTNQAVDKESDTTGKTVAAFAEEVGLPKSLLTMFKAGSKSAKPKKQRTSTVATSLPPEQLLKSATKTNKKLANSFRKGASKRLLDKIAAEAQQTLPESFNAVWSMFDGQKPGSPGLFHIEEFDRDYRMLSIEEIIREWWVWYDLLTSNEFAGMSISTDGKVRRAWYDENWMPVASDGAGNFLCLDLNPTSKGVFGQLLSLDHEEGDRRVVASSIEAALAVTLGTR